MRTHRVRPNDEANKNPEFILDFLSEEERTTFAKGKSRIPPGVLLMVVYIFSALSRMPAFKRWFPECTIKPIRVEKTTENHELIRETNTKEKSDDYDDGL